MKKDLIEKWVTCEKCKGDFKVKGYPAGKQTKYTDAINCHQLLDTLSGIVYLYPTVCIFCADYREAKPERKPAAKKNVRQPNADA